MMSHGCVFLGRVFMWCLVAFFCGRDEHSTASAARPPPGRAGKPTHGRACLAGAGAGDAAVLARSAVTGDMLAAAWGRRVGSVSFGIRREVALDWVLFCVVGMLC